MLKIGHTSGCQWTQEIEFLCPNCNLPFCEEDSQQAGGGVLLGHYLNKKKIDHHSERLDNLRDDLNDLKDKFKALKDRIDACTKCPK